jgi:uncharacterized membrane-anchored protein YhcB (DUF1043 family)
MSQELMPLTSGWQRRVQSWRQSLAANTRLRWMLALIGLVIVVELGLRWFDDVQVQLNQRAELMATLSQIKTQVKDPKKLEDTLASAELAKSLADERVLQVGFEALAQAQLHDWITKITKEANVQVLRLTVGSARAVAARPSGNALGAVGANAPRDAAHLPAGLGATLGAGGPASMQAASASMTAAPMVEVPVTLVIRFSPQTLGSVLEQIESGDWLVRVETLSVRRNERRVDIGMVVPVRLQGGVK